MLDIPTARANRQARRTSATTTPEATGLGTQPASSDPLTPQQPTTGPGMTSLTPTTTTANPWMSYGEYFAGKPEEAEAQKYSMYHPSTPDSGEGMDWGASGNPYRFGNEYNAYKEGLPLIYQDLINYGISPEMVASGQVHSLARGSSIEKIPTDPAEAMSIYGSVRDAPVGTLGGPTSAIGPLPGGGVGSGSFHTLAPEVLSKMWG